MTLGYVFALLAMASLGVMGLLYKLADRRGVPPLTTAVVLFTSASLAAAAYVGMFQRGDFSPPRGVILIAVIFGVITLVATWAFLNGLRVGKISTSWVIITLSAALPTVASTVIYREKLGPRKGVALGLAAVAILLLWRDMRDNVSDLHPDLRKTGAGAEAGDVETAGSTEDVRR